MFVFGFAAVIAWPQEPAFEVASVRRSASPEQPGFNGARHGGPGSDDPTRLSLTRYRMPDLIMMAYGLEGYQLPGVDFLRPMPSYDITANVPPGTSPDTFGAMMRRLLLERFHLRVHWDKRPGDIYALLQAKGGHKLKPPSARSEAPTQSAPKLAPDGLPDLPAGQSIAVYRSGLARLQAVDESVGFLVQRLTADLHAPVVDDTGLAGKYDYRLTWKWGIAPDSTASDEPILETALIQQLGLRIEKRKGTVDVLLVDSYDASPAEN